MIPLILLIFYHIMPITGPSSYPATLSAFLSHWETANTVITSGAIVLEGGAVRADLVLLQTELEAARDAVSDLSVDLALARASLRILLNALQARVVEFNARVRGDLAATAFPGALPDAFSVGQGESIVREGLRKVARIWLGINGLGSSTPVGVVTPYELNGHYLFANLDTDREALRAAYRAVSDAEVDLAIARGQRNKVQLAIYAKMKSYRQKMAGYEVGYPELFTTLPALSPAPGHTPDPVPVQVTWNAATSQARIIWDASTDADLQSYEVRASAGDHYDSEDESILATVPAGGLRELFTSFALTSPGLTAGFKVYVVLNTGNEHGSEAVYLQRPV